MLVVAYGTMGGAERLWWLLRHFGHDECAVLIGGIGVWGGRLQSGAEEIDPATLRRASEKTTRFRRELAARLADPSSSLVDARTPDRWRGEPNPIDDLPGGFRRAERAVGETQPELPEGELVAYCGSGVTACVVLHRAALRRPRRQALPGRLERVVDSAGFRSAGLERRR